MLHKELNTEEKRPVTSAPLYVTKWRKQLRPSAKSNNLHTMTIVTTAVTSCSAKSLLFVQTKFVLVSLVIRASTVKSVVRLFEDWSLSTVYVSIVVAYASHVNQSYLVKPSETSRYAQIVIIVRDVNSPIEVMNSRMDGVVITVLYAAIVATCSKTIPHTTTTTAMCAKGAMMN
jgi:poly(A) polymerase Pap1